MTGNVWKLGKQKNEMLKDHNHTSKRTVAES